MNEIVEFAIICVLLVGGLVVGVVVIGSVGSRLSFPMASARIEQLRADTARVDAAASEDVIGQVVEVNKAIASHRACNQLWYCDLTTTDKWNAVALIPVPQKGPR